MHALGISHPEVRNIIRGFDKEVEKVWQELSSMDVTMILTADHGHVNVQPTEMVQLPDDMLQCLEYANIGVHGKGRHGFFHCKDGRQQDFLKLWSRQSKLRENFLLLSIEEAAAEGLFGVGGQLPSEVRPRLGDFVSISVNHCTLSTPSEVQCHRHHCQGAHGSLTEQEMAVPFILLMPNSKQGLKRGCHNMSVS